MKHWVWLLVLAFVPAQAASQDVIVAPQHLPMRAIPDTRKIAHLRWDLDAIDSLLVIDQRTDSLRIEHALCLYGYVSMSLDSLFVKDARTPLEIQQQDSVSIAVRCDQTAYFIGLVHTHIYSLSLESLLFDFRVFSMSPQLIIGVVIANGEMMWFGREVFSGIWPYKEASADLRKP